MKSWRTESALACGTISYQLSAISNQLKASGLGVRAWLLVIILLASMPVAGKPAVVLIDPEDRQQWQTWISALPTESGWQVITPAVAANTPIDARVQAIETAAREAVKNGAADPSHLYLAGRNETAAAVFYTISRVPDLWAGAVALGSSPQPAIDTGRIYAANFSLVPVLWAGNAAGDQEIASKLAAEGLKLEWRSADKLSVAALFAWLAAHAREEFPASIDCETNSPTFTNCYWVRMTKLDAAEHNDVLASSRIAPAIKPALDLGNFSYKPEDPGPGILISSLPDKYTGRLKLGDRIVELNGRLIADAQAYGAMMAEFKEERPVSVMVQSGKEKIRLETSVILPTRAPSLTARVQASFDPGEREIQIISRAVTEMQVTVPAHWTPSVINWNGVVLEKLESVEGPRCYVLRVEKELENIAACATAP